MNSEAIRFIDDPIEVHFEIPPVFSKSPPCPDGFYWKDDYFRIKALLFEEKRWERRGRMSRNIRPEHTERAKTTGSRGVGRFFFTIQTENDRYFKIYYDRAPKNALDSSGGWFLFKEYLQNPANPGER